MDVTHWLCYGFSCVDERKEIYTLVYDRAATTIQRSAKLKKIKKEIQLLKKKD